MRLRPIHTASNPPEVYNVADQVYPRRLVRPQEVQEGFGLARFSAKVNVRNEKGPMTLHVGVSPFLIVSSRVQHIVSADSLNLYQLCDAT